MQNTPEKHPDHHHYFIADEYLYEAYKTCRGIRYLVVMEMPGQSDTADYQFPKEMTWLEEEKCKKYH
jgi:hypothetical protein